MVEKNLAQSFSRPSMGSFSAAGVWSFLNSSSTRRAVKKKRNREPIFGIVSSPPEDRVVAQRRLAGEVEQRDPHGPPGSVRELRGCPAGGAANRGG